MSLSLSCLIGKMGLVGPPKPSLGSTAEAVGERARPQPSTQEASDGRMDRWPLFPSCHVRGLGPSRAMPHPGS